MNDIAKTSTAARLIKAMEREKLGPADTGRIIGILPQYVSMMKKPEYYSKCPASAWEAALKWANSGQTLEEYSQKHGAVLKPEKAETIVITNLPENSKTMSMVNADNIAAREAEQAEKEPTISLAYYKEQADIASKRIKELEEANNRLLMQFSQYPLSLSELAVTQSEPQKVKIDIEINLIINGKKITLA